VPAADEIVTRLADDGQLQAESRCDSLDCRWCFPPFSGAEVGVHRDSSRPWMTCSVEDGVDSEGRCRRVLAAAERHRHDGAAGDGVANAVVDCRINHRR